MKKCVHFRNHLSRKPCQAPCIQNVSISKIIRPEKPACLFCFVCTSLNIVLLTPGVNRGQPPAMLTEVIFSVGSQNDHQNKLKPTITPPLTLDNRQLDTR